MFKTNVQFINSLYNTRSMPAIFFLNRSLIVKLWPLTRQMSYGFMFLQRLHWGFFFRKKCIKRHLHVLPWLVLICVQLIFKESGVKVWACWGLTFTPCYQALKTAIKEMLLPLIYMKLTPWMSGSLKKTKKDIIGRNSDISRWSLLELCGIQPQAKGDKSRSTLWIYFGEE